MIDPRTAGREARQAFLQANPEPAILDFACPRCKAEPGSPCAWRVPTHHHTTHLPRQDRLIRALGRRMAQAIKADDDAYNAAYKAFYGQPTQQGDRP